ncbi:MAG: hypothetical protein JWO86_6235 [Myxococcaceae bacterium]|nr:hypothetical protein [Myxococcaceae bacterium]MEA2751730.1 hypothetical protein [Myxococcales bacterium]
MSSPSLALRLGHIVLLALVALAMTACTHVAPYDRGRLAHPTMTQAVGSAAADHLHAVQEGAAGGGSVAESGCGCN